MTPSNTARFRTLFISDFHLGASESRADELRRFLRRVDCDTIYLVGDILDLWCLKRRWHWPEANNRVVNRLLKFAKRGTRVVYIPGNHDETLRKYDGLRFGGIEIALEAEHCTADGRTYLVTHGDEFDLVVRHAPLLSAIGGHAYDGLLKINRRFNSLRALLGLEYWSLSSFLKLKVKSACKYISKFEDAVIAEAKRREFDGVICGHVHKVADVRGSGGSGSVCGGVHYLNCGEWVEGSHAVVEYDDGRMEAIDAFELTKKLEQADREPERQLALAGARVGAGLEEMQDDDMADDFVMPMRRVLLTQNA